jgi:hypothetical protein
LSSKEGVVRRCLIPLDEAEDGDLQAKLLLLKGGIKGRKKKERTTPNKTGDNLTWSSDPSVRELGG